MYQDNPFDVIECNTGTCNVDGTGSPSCLCPPGCTGETCADDGKIGSVVNIAVNHLFFNCLLYL